MIVNKAYFYCPQCGKEADDYVANNLLLKHPVYDKRLDSPLYHVMCTCGNCLAGYSYISLHDKEDKEHTKRIIRDYNRGGFHYSAIMEKYLRDLLKES